VTCTAPRQTLGGRRGAKLIPLTRSTTSWNLSSIVFLLFLRDPTGLRLGVGCVSSAWLAQPRVRSVTDRSSHGLDLSGACASLSLAGFLFALSIALPVLLEEADEEGGEGGVLRVTFDELA
jgi:hypothetical protein